jgi:hypothetical protein
VSAPFAEPAAPDPVLPGGARAGDDGGGVTVTMRDGGGQPLAGCDVVLRQNGVDLATTTTDAAGNFSFGSRADGYYEVALAPPAGWAGGYGQWVQVTAGQDCPVTLSATAWGGIAGAVQDNQGAGQAGWVVNLSLNGTALGSTTSDATGAFSFPGLADGFYTLALTPQAGWETGYFGGWATVTAGQTAEVLLVVLPWGGATGTLTDYFGNGLSGWTVVARDTGSGTLAGLPGGYYEVTARHRRPPCSTVTVSAPSWVLIVSFTASPSSASAHTQVVWRALRRSSTSGTRAAVEAPGRVAVITSVGSPPASASRTGARSGTLTRRSTASLVVRLVGVASTR